MTYQEYNTQAKVTEYLGKPLTGKYRKIHDFLTGIWDGTEVVSDSQYDGIFLRKEGKWYFYQVHKNERFYCNYTQAWSFFRSDMNMEDIEIQGFVKDMVEQHLKCEVETPTVVSG